MSPKRLLLLAASVVAALDANAPPSLVSDCTVPASAYAIRACAAERLNLAHGDPALRPLSEEESMRGVISAARGPRSACVECLSAIDAIAGRWLQNTAREDDFVALKFDVDNDFSLGPTMEWGFLADLLRSPKALALVDELLIELHFFAPSLRWVHPTHSMKQAFDVLRQLRACGLPVHAWP